jgi:hypothetical protein
MKGDGPEYTGSTEVEGGVLTLDNPHLSRLKNGPSDDPGGPPNEGQLALIEDQAAPVSTPSRAVNCKTKADPVSDEVATLIEASVAESTRRAYRSDLAHFAAWGCTLPAEPALVASYLAAHAETLSVATLVRRIATISKAHEARGCRTLVDRKSSGPRCGASSAHGGSPSAKPSRCCERTCFGSSISWARV